MPQYPTAPATFPTRVDGELIFAEHMNAVQAEIEQVTSGLLTGLFHDLYPAFDATYKLGLPTRRWDEVWAVKANVQNLTVQDLVITGSVVAPPSGPIQYLDFVEQIPPAPGDPAINHARLHALDASGFTVLEVRDGDANVVRLASDNVLIGKIVATALGGIARGQVVYLAGANGANPLIGLAKADSLTTLPALGLALDPGAANSFIRVLLGGTLQKLNTSAFIEGDRVFVSETTAGALTSVLPTAPAFAQRVGIVTRSHATQGEIVVVTTSIDGPPRLHAPTHAAGGTDPLVITSLPGYPGGITNFLRADGTFAAPPFAPPPDLSGLVPYVGATATVNLGTRQIIAGRASFSDEVDLTGGTGTGFSTAPIEVVLASTPRIAFHWPGVVASQIGMNSAGVIQALDNPGTGLASFQAQDVTTNGAISAGTDLQANSALIVGTGVYPGRQDAPAGKQTSWYLQSHGSYGLITNTGLYLGGGLYPQGGMDPGYLLRENNLTNFVIPDGIGSFTVNTTYHNYFMRHNGMLFVSWMMDVSWISGTSYAHFYIPPGFVAQQYASSKAVVFCNGNSFDVYTQISPGSNVIFVYSSNGNVFFGSGRYSGQLMIFVG